MKKVKKNKSQSLLPGEVRNSLSRDRAVLIAVGMLCLSPVFGVAYATESDVPHQIDDNLLLTERMQQSKKITGTVVDQQGLSIPGAAVHVKGTTVGTVTDIDGKFELDVPADAVLVVSYIGMQTHEVHVGKKSVLDIILSESNIGLDEVVVVGYGTQKKATLTGSISSVGGEDLKKMAAVNLSNTLAGKTAGVIANTRSGEPGEDGATIQIRGQGTFGSTSPLIVVDGIADRSFSRLNPEDIESITVLKDASAAIYGARAANGVILVTTKRGRDGKTSITYSGRVGFSQPTRVPEMLNAYEYMTYINEYNVGHSGTPAYNDQMLEWAQNGQNLYQYPNTNWWKEVAKDWSTQTEHSLSVSGGNDKVSFYTSAQYMWQDVIYKESPQDYGQFQITSNLDAKVGKYIKIGMDIQGRQEKRGRGVFDTSYLFDFFMKCKPIYNAYSPDEQHLPMKGMEYASTNPALMVTDKPGENHSTYNYLNLKPKVRIDLDFLTKGLYAEGYAAIDFMFRDGKTINHPYDVYEYVSSGKEGEGVWGTLENIRSQTGAISVSVWSDKSTRRTLNGRIGYSRTFDDVHKVDAFVAYEQNKYDYSTMSAYRTNFISTEIPEINAGSDVPEDQSNGGYSDRTARQNYFGRINYGYKDKYLAEFTLRYDGSMNFAKGHRWGAFPGFSLGWVMSEESFWENLKPAVNFFKLRGSWGMMGNDNISAYQYLSQYSFGNSIQFGSLQKTMYLSLTANPLVTWEKARTTNLGFSAYFLEGKFSLDFDYFFSKRNDILLTRNASVPAYSGLTLPAENIGKMNNRGVEFVASYQDKSGDLSWGVTGNFTFAKNKAVYMDEAVNLVDWRRVTGHAYGGMTLYKALGIYQTQEEIDNSPHLPGTQIGDLKYEDYNNDGQITEDDQRYYENYSTTPKIIYGFTLNGGWKGFDLNVFFQGQAMAKVSLRPTMNMVRDFYDDRWMPTNTAEENAAARWPRAFVNASGYYDSVNGLSSTWWVRNAAFLRLKSIEVGYTLPKEWISKVGLERTRIYFNANNLFTIDGIGIIDPEATTILSYPLNRTLNMGVNVTF